MRMRAVLILVAAVMFGLAGGYAWFVMSRPAAHAHVRKVPREKPLAIPETAADQDWQTRAEDRQSVHYAGCNEVRAAGKAPLYEGQPGYRADMDGDGDGVACEPHPGA